jgi:hypothetical protein
MLSWRVVRVGFTRVWPPCIQLSSALLCTFSTLMLGHCWHPPGQLRPLVGPHVLDEAFGSGSSQVEFVPAGGEGVISSTPCMAAIKSATVPHQLHVATTPTVVHIA